MVCKHGWVSYITRVSLSTAGPVIAAGHVNRRASKQSINESPSCILAARPDPHWVRNKKVAACYLLASQRMIQRPL